MDFLFRIPLFDFDIYSEFERKKNWKHILKAIEYSSPDLYREISGKTFENLSFSLQMKVFKYLIRGRYRSTPFGLMAGTGVGLLKNKPKKVIDISNRKILQNSVKKLDSGPIWHLAIRGNTKFGKVNYLTFLPDEERWVFVNIPKNPIIDLLENHFKQSFSLQYQEFRSWFEMPVKGCIDTIWNHLIKTGILYQLPEIHQENQKHKLPLDTVLIDPLELPYDVKEEIQKFFNTAGNLFTKQTNPYLKSFENWFLIEFDDRFVPLPILLQYREFWESHFLSDSIDIIENRLSSYFIKKEPIDLKIETELIPIPEEIFDLGVLFRKLEGDQILIENFVCNRPFSYIGRFNRDNRIYSYQSIQKERIYPKNDCLYAELSFFENSTVNGICNTVELFEWKINPFHCPQSFRLADLELGIRNGEFLLFHRTLNKRVIPIVTHPLNGKEISHPILRLLWEISLEPGYKFQLYQEGILAENLYSPEIKWGNIILQPRKWILFRNQFESKSTLLNWLEKNSIPETISIGIYDRELIIRWKEKMELDIFWQELGKSPRITLKEPLWLKNPLFYSSRGAEVYPQFVINMSRQRMEFSWNGFVNSIDFEESDCLYLLVKVQSDELEDFLSFYFSKNLTSFLLEQKIVWYYLIYPENDFLQVRIRYLNIHISIKCQLIDISTKQLTQEKIDFKQKTYYPEVRKYGKTRYKKSEQIFWMESAISRSWGKNSHENDLNIHLKFLEIIILWEKILLDQWTVSKIFEILKKKVKILPYRENSKFILNNNLNQTENQDPYFPNDWVINYSNLICQILNEIKSNQEKWTVLNHHIHMQMNRFFLLERDQFESQLYRQLYKRIGRKLFLK